ncbi:putative DNA-directed polymerase kappa, partial [Hortaea werneckii]
DRTNGGDVARCDEALPTRLFGLLILPDMPLPTPSPIVLALRSAVTFGADTFGLLAFGDSSSVWVGVALPALNNLAADRGVTLPLATASLPATSSCRTRGATLGGSDRTVAVLDIVGLVAGATACGAAACLFLSLPIVVCCGGMLSSGKVEVVRTLRPPSMLSGGVSHAMKLEPECLPKTVAETSLGALPGAKVADLTASAVPGTRENDYLGKLACATTLSDRTDGSDVRMPRHNADLAGEAENAIASASDSATPAPPASQHHTLKYHLLGPSLTKSGQDGVDQQKVSEIIYNASKGSKYFNNEENKDKTLTVKIQRILAKKRELERIETSGGLKNEMKRADDFIAELECGRDLSQVVVHVDCDAFYAAVEELDRPELKEVLFAVGKGVLTTCNYVARKFGCRSGMAGFVADKLCPQLIHLPLNFDKYTAKAKEVRAVLEQYDPRFESASIDEAYLNITEYCREHNMEPEDAVAQMRAEVEEKTKITISAGIAANAKIAKVCSNKNKPNGQFRLPSDRSSIVAFMRDLPTRKVNGIGRVFERELDAIGVKTCG